MFLGHPDRNTPYFSFIMMILLIEFLRDVGIISSVLYNGEAKTDRLWHRNNNMFLKESDFRNSEIYSWDGRCLKNIFKDMDYGDGRNIESLRDV